MASRRHLKKAVHYIFSDMISVCLSLGSEGKDEAEIRELITRLLSTHNELTRRISHTEPGNVRGFYRSLEEHLSSTISEFVQQVGGLSRES